MTRLLVLAFLFFSAEAYSQASICKATCNGQKAVTPFDFFKRVQQTGDPNTGGPLQSTFKIPSTPDGQPDKEVSADQFLGEINQFEEWSAKECGQSLNQDGDVLVAVPCDNAAMNNRRRAAVVGAHKTEGPALPGVAAVNAVYEEAKNPALQEAQKKFIWRRNDGVALRHKNCFVNAQFETPGKEIFGVYAGSEFCGSLTASKIPNNNPVMVGVPADTVATLGGNAKAGVYVFNQDINIVRVTASLISGFNKDQSREVYGYLFGKAVYNNIVAGKDLKWDYNYTAGSVEKSVSQTFMIGPVPISVAAGARGKVGINFVTRQTGLYANAHILPYVDTVAFAEGAVNVVIAKAGVEVVLNPLFRDTLDLYGLEAIVATMIQDINGNKLYTFKASSHVALLNKVEALSGQMNLFLAIVRPKFFGWKWKKYTMNLFSWEGIKAQGYLFNKGDFNTPIYNLK